ncbi:MAG: RNA-directed polymerase, partial [Actinomycetota bacterium]|nr:RNA-directed polymerase [Actinomycetota bacterium]
MGKGGSGIEKGRTLQCRKTPRRMAELRALGPGYWRCRPSFTVGRWPIPAAGSMTCSISCTTRRRCWWRSSVAGNRGARTPGVDGLTVTEVEEKIGVPGFLNDLRAAVKDGSFRPLPVRERSIPKPGGSGRVRKLGIPTIADRVVQAALKLVLEPIFEADFKPVSYGFRPRRRAQDAIAEIHYFGTHGYRWVLDADIEACFDSIDHTALMDRVRHRVKDKRVLSLVKAFLKAGVLTELGESKETLTGTPQGGILSPLLANIALSALDEHLHGPWEPGGEMATEGKRAYRRRKGRPTWRVVRYADDFVVLVHGTEADTAVLREE